MFSIIFPPSKQRKQRFSLVTLIFALSAAVVTVVAAQNADREDFDKNDDKNPFDALKPYDSGHDKFDDSPADKESNKNINVAFDKMINEIRKTNVGIGGLRGLRRDPKGCTRTSGSRYFRCDAIAKNVQVDQGYSGHDDDDDDDKSYGNKRSDKSLKFDLRLSFRGKIRRNLVTKLKLDDASIRENDDSTETGKSEDSRGWSRRPYGSLRHLKRQLKRAYHRLRHEAKHIAKRILPIELRGNAAKPGDDLPGYGGNGGDDDNKKPTKPNRDQDGNGKGDGTSPAAAPADTDVTVASYQ